MTEPQQIALIDDNPHDRALARHALSQTFPTTVYLEIGDPAAFARALAEQPLDAVVTDYQLHWSDGLTVLRQIKERRPECPVVMLTGTGSEEVAVAAMRAGAEDYVTKAPQHYRRLPEVVRVAIERAALRQRAIELEREHGQALAREHAARLEAEQAVQLRDQFLAVASHELKTPLTSVLGYIELLQRRLLHPGRLEPRDARALHVVAEQAGRLGAMVDLLLDVSRIQSGQLQLSLAPVDLAALARRVAEEVQPTLRRHRLALAVDHAPLLVSGDALRLEQVMNNLLQNAVKYSPDGGAITLTARPRGGLAELTVVDQGIGIPPDSLPHIFQRFYRASNVDDRHISGMGVGLYVVREIVTLHGGEISAESQLGAGSSFRVRLPLLDGDGLRDSVQ